MSSAQPSLWRRLVRLVVGIFLAVGGFIAVVLIIWLLFFFLIFLLVAFFGGGHFFSTWNWQISALVATVLTGMFTVQAVGEMLLEGSFRGAWWAIKKIAPSGSDDDGT